MRHRVKGRVLRRRRGPRIALLRGLVKELIAHGRITTTEGKAREARGLAERLITKGKGGTLHDRRKVLEVVTDDGLVAKLFDEIAPRYATRSGGYTRTLRLMPRPGDAAPMVMLELV